MTKQRSLDIGSHQIDSFSITEGQLVVNAGAYTITFSPEDFTSRGRRAVLVPSTTARRVDIGLSEITLWLPANDIRNIRTSLQLSPVGSTAY